MKIYEDLSAIQILCENKFGHFGAPKNSRFDHLSISEVLIFWELLTLSSVKFFQKSKFKVFKIVKTAIFDNLNSIKVDFT